MEIERVDDLDLIQRLGHSDAPRTTDRLHLSDIYKVLMRRLQPKRFTGGPMDMAKIETGLLMENMLERGLTEKFATVRPGEIVSDEGIYMSPDGVNPTEMCGEEYKCTWMSSRPQKGCSTPYTDEYGMPNQKYLHWFIQMKGYAKWLGTDTFLLRALHINGDYDRSHKFSPEFVTHRIHFTQPEIDDNWAGMLNVAREEGLLR